MKAIRTRALASVLTGALAVCCVSCNDGPTGQGASKTVQTGPEESLAQIMEVFRRRMEDTPIGFVATNSTGRTAMTGTNKVSYELVKPASDEESPRAIITVESQSHYSILRSAEVPDEEEGEKANEETPSIGLDEAAPDDFATTPTDPDNPDGEMKRTKKSRPGEESVRRRPNVEVRKYELAYQDGRWRLVTKLNEQTEKAIENAFNNALETQI